MAKPVTGVLVMAYGSPEQKEDILPYFTDIRGGRTPSPEALAGLERRYAAIGGRSHLNETSSAQAEGVGRLLNGAGDGTEYRVYQANKHWHPRIPDVIRQMSQDGIERVVAIVLSPLASRLSSGTYFQIVDQTVADIPAGMAVTPIPGWHLEPAFIQALTARVEAAIAKFPECNREDVVLVFTAHSLPQRILTWGDPYPTELQESGAAVAARAGLEKVHFAYQSASPTPEPWLGPDIKEKVRELAAAGEKAVVVCPVGFIADHLEILYDLDIELKREAEGLGVHVERIGMLNDDPMLLEALAAVVRRTAGGE